MRLLQRAAGVTLRDAVENARGAEPVWVEIGWALRGSRQSVNEQVND
jgi:hypothetical protein